MDHNLPSNRWADVTSRWGVAKTWWQRMCSYLYKYKQMIEKPKHESCLNGKLLNTNIISIPFQIFNGSFLPSCGYIWIPSPLEENKEEILKMNSTREDEQYIYLLWWQCSGFWCSIGHLLNDGTLHSRIYIIMVSWEKQSWK